MYCISLFCRIRFSKLGQTSRTAKCRLFESFRAVARRLGHTIAETDPPPSYRTVKDDATDFQSAKNAMYARFRANGFGKWVRKPPEEEMFMWTTKLHGPPSVIAAAKLPTSSASVGDDNKNVML